MFQGSSSVCFWFLARGRPASSLYGAVQRLLEKLGLRPDPALCASEDEQQQLGEAPADADPQASEAHPALLACYSAATQELDLFAERAGQPSLRLVDPSLARPEEPHAVRRGINVHAKLSVGGNDRARLERLCCYLKRGRISRSVAAVCYGRRHPRHRATRPLHESQMPSGKL